MENQVDEVNNKYKNVNEDLQTKVKYLNNLENDLKDAQD